MEEEKQTTGLYVDPEIGIHAEDRKFCGDPFHRLVSQAFLGGRPHEQLYGISVVLLEIKRLLEAQQND